MHIYAKSPPNIHKHTHKITRSPIKILPTGNVKEIKDFHGLKAKIIDYLCKKKQDDDIHKNKAQKIRQMINDQQI